MSNYRSPSADRSDSAESTPRDQSLEMQHNNAVKSTPRVNPFPLERIPTNRGEIPRVALQHHVSTTLVVDAPAIMGRTYTVGGQRSLEESRAGGAVNLLSPGYIIHPSVEVPMEVDQKE
jgi:hypothetical protein